MRTLALCLCLALSISACAATDGNSPQQNNGGDATNANDGGAKYGVQTGALTMKQDPVTTKWTVPQSCSGPNDANCNSVGPGQRLMCDPDSLCRLYKADDGFNYDPMTPFDPDASLNTFSWIPCGNTQDCVNNNPYPDKDLTSTCLHTQNAETQTTSGTCFYAYKTCKAGKNSPCEVIGYNLCDNSGCNCSAAADLSKALTVEVCDGVDNNCNGTADEENALGSTEYWLDGDGDKYGSTGAVSKKLCSPNVAAHYTATVGGDCNDSATSINPAAKEICDGVDNDCNGLKDDTLSFVLYYVDADGDGHGAGNGTSLCQDPGSGYSLSNDDCDDTNNNKAFQTKLFYVDSDGDGHGSLAFQMLCALTAPANFSDLSDDCDDVSGPHTVNGVSGVLGAAIHDGASEICDQLDNNCDGLIDQLPGANGGPATPVCDTKCPIAKTIALSVNVNDWKVVSMSDYAANNISTYQCGSQSKPMPINFAAKEALIVPDCPIGQKFSVQTNTPGVFVTLLHGDCNSVNNAVGPAKCLAFGTTSVAGGIVGTDYVSVDATANKSFNVKFTCTP